MHKVFVAGAAGLDSHTHKQLLYRLIYFTSLALFPCPQQCFIVAEKSDGVDVCIHTPIHKYIEICVYMKGIK